MESKEIVVRGAREHNLKNINVNLPRNKLIVITGLSGSGKSSLAFDTIYADGQRRYVESLSAYARQFLEMMNKPDVDSIEGLSPAISIEQKTTSKNPRSTVGTVTEIYDYLRLLFARIGIPYSPSTGQPIESMSISSIVDNIINLGEGNKIILLSPIVRGRKGEYRKEFVDLQRRGFARVKIDGTIYEIDEIPELDKQIKHTIEVVIDRIIIKEEAKNRIASSVETALNLSDGIIIAEEASDSNKRHTFSSNFACPESGFTIEEIEPRIFSFNSPFGACNSCDGIGKGKSFDEKLIVANENLSLNEGAISPWKNSQNKMYYQTLYSIANHYKADMNTPWEMLDEKLKSVILYGTKDIIKFDYDDGMKSFSMEKPFEGVIPNIKRKYREATSVGKEEFEKYQSEIRCTECSGHRLKIETLSIKIADKHIGEISQLSITECLEWFKELPSKLTDQQNKIGDKIIKEIQDRLEFLNNVGLSYLSLARSSGTLSGGESQRIRLASQIGSGLTGVLYVLDEPSIGLHQRDNDKLLDTLKSLRDQGNTVIVVEHDEDAIKTADYVVDIGPGAGINGGKIVAEGTLQDIMQSKDSITAQYLSGKKEISKPKKRRKGNGKFIELIGAKQNNLKNIDLKIPLGTLTCITGVSGSGKSTLTLETLKAILSRELMGAKTKPGKYDSIKGIHHLDKIIDIDQSPIGRTPRSNPATYTGAFTYIRDWFTALPESKARGYQSGRFSFNNKGGRCESCQGDGVIKIEMHFLPDVYVECEQCKGKRYNRETLEIKMKNKNISDVLDMTIDEAEKFFRAIPTINEKMRTLQEVGLGYITVGQKATTLSGGEAQRIKLSKELSRRSTGRTMYILDEPTTGLHFEDIKNLLKVLHTLVENGNSVIVIEHNIDVIKTADYIVDIGPEGGDQGGRIVAQGTPETVAECEESYTAKYLRKSLK
jgi:excinuclease ABC subunit A